MCVYTRVFIWVRVRVCVSAGARRNDRLRETKGDRKKRKSLYYQLRHSLPLWQCVLHSPGQCVRVCVCSSIIILSVSFCVCMCVQYAFVFLCVSVYICMVVYLYIYECVCTCVCMSVCARVCVCKRSITVQ